MLTGPPPKFHGTRDILGQGRAALCFQSPSAPALLDRDPLPRRLSGGKLNRVWKGASRQGGRRDPNGRQYRRTERHPAGRARRREAGAAMPEHHPETPTPEHQVLPMLTFQQMPDLSTEQYAALRADIEQRGIVVPIVVDQHGRVLDGHNRKAIGDELGIEVPCEVREVGSDEEAADLAVTLNCARRHLTREQTREVIAHEIARRPQDSDRAIAKRVGCSPSTVGAVRKPQVSNLDTPEDGTGPDTMTPEEAEALNDKTARTLLAVRDATGTTAVLAMMSGATQAEVLLALTPAQRSLTRRADPAHAEVFRHLVFDSVTEIVLNPEGPPPREPDLPFGKQDLLDILAAAYDRESADDELPPADDPNSAAIHEHFAEIKGRWGLITTDT